MRDLVVLLLKAIMRKGQIVRTYDLYSAFRLELPGVCESLGFTSSKPIEPKWQNEIRLGLLDATNLGLIEHIGSPKSCLWKRI